MQNACTLFVTRPDTDIWTGVRKYRNALLHNEVLWDEYNVLETPL